MQKKNPTIAELQKLIKDKDEEFAKLKRKSLIKDAKIEAMQNAHDAEKKKLEGTIMILRRHLEQQLKTPITLFEGLSETDSYVQELLRGEEKKSYSKKNNYAHWFQLSVFLLEQFSLI